MKKFYLLCCIAFLHTILFAQAPQKFSYQAVVRDQNSALITNQKVGVKISVLQNSIQGTAVYEETHNVQSNENGLITLEIGTGKALVGSFVGIDWATGSYFVKNEIDPKGAENYTIVSTNQLMSVPYALFAANSQPGPKGEKGDAGKDGKDGINGVDGKDGAQGPAGKDGTNGVDGKDGAQGPAGKDGINGVDGKDGAVGPQGPIGLTGPAGKDGSGSTPGKLPTVTTNKVEEFIPDNSNVGLGRHLKISHTVTDDGGETVLKRGFCISENPNPTTAGKTVSNNDGNTLGASEDYFMDVTSNKKYYVRAFAVNTKGTTYGNEMVITTMDIKIPTVSTISVTDVSYREATFLGNVDNSGNQKPRIGFCIGTQAGITTSNAIVVYCDSLTNFSAKLSKLQHSTTYYVRAFAVNIAGIGYGNELSFSTLKIFKPNIQTIGVDSIGFIYASISGKIINDGGDAIESSGMCIGTTNTPTINDIFAYNNSGNGTSIQAITNNLAPNTTYYVRAYAKNSAGETYGNAIKFNTLTIDIITDEVKDISLFEANFNGELKHIANLTNFETGFCYSEKPKPTSSDLIASNWKNGTTFTVNANNLNSNTTYYVRAYIRINGNYAYGNEVTFKTPSITLTTLPVSNIKGTKTLLTGSLSDSILAQNKNLGFCYSTSPNPSINDQVVSNWNYYSSSKFQYQITELKQNTTYYVRAFIKSNSDKVVYGNEVSFTSGTVKLPTITTDSVSEINLYQARFFKTIVDDGGEVTEEGFCIATHTIPTIKDIVNSGYTNDLNMNTKYYVRAYAKNAAGIVYGNELTFKTLSLTLTTQPVSNIKGTKAYLTGKVSDSIAAQDKLLGFCYGTSPNPSINNIVVNNWNYNKSALFQYEISGLKQNTLYYVKSFIQSNNGKIIYGNEVSFTSGSVKLPTITSDSVSEINLHTARLHKTIVDDGGENISEQGFCVATHTAPTTKDIVVESYTNYVNNLQINTKYYVRAYAKNSIGIAYGNEISFTTANIKVETVSITKVTFASAEMKAKITESPKSNQNSDKRMYFLISTKADPTFTDNELVLNEWNYSDSLTKIYNQLEPATTYYVKAAYILYNYSYNYRDTAYGSTLSFTTKTAPKVETFTPTKISSNDVVFSGSNENSNGYIFTQRGFIVSTKPNISYTNKEFNISANNGGIGAFEATGGFKPNTTYYVKAYIASNDGLSVYGNEISFKTLAVGHKGQGGGIVFYDKGETTDGWRYLEVAPNDQSAGAIWGCKDIQIEPWYQNKNPGGGLANTNDIMSKCKDQNSAASICDNLVSGGKTDWYLPNIQELSLLYNNMHLQNLGNFNQVYYWSSENYYQINNATLFGMNGGDQQNYDTQFTGSVRAIRRY
jgi:hypothetical protein